jgi:hypothetical protein
VVLHGVVGAAGEEPRDHRPLVAVEAVRRHQPLLLLVAERPLADPRVQLVEPPQAAALPCVTTDQKPTIAIALLTVNTRIKIASF